MEIQLITDKSIGEDLINPTVTKTFSFVDGWFKEEIEENIDSVETEQK